MSLVMLLTGFGGLLAAWTVSNPLAAAPDEPGHYVKALGAAYGQWSGDIAIQPSPQMTPRDRGMAGVTRTFRIPARYALYSGPPDGQIPLPGWWDVTRTITAPAAGGPQPS